MSQTATQVTTLASATAMPSSTDNPERGSITIKKLHATFGAEVGGVDFSKPIDEKVLDEIKAAASQVGVELSHLCVRCYS